MMNDFSPLLGPENFFIHGDFHHNPGKRIIMPREAGPYFESFLISRVRAPFLIAFTDNIHGFFQESLLNDLARFPNGIFHVIASGRRGESGKIQVLGKAIIIEITFPESRTPFEDKGIGKCRYLADTGENPGKQIITFDNMPRNAGGLVRLRNKGVS